jgi:transposase InsO family protein
VAGFIAAQRADYDIPHATACRALSVSAAWFYKWRHGDPSPQHARRDQLTVEIRRLFAAHRGTYGSPRITADLRAEGWRVSENTVAAMMRECGLAARRRRRRKQTTRPGRGRWRAPDLIGRDFGTDRLNHKWYGDGTEIVTDEGKLYLDSVLDMGSRRIVGFALGEHHDTNLAEAALQMAVAVRGGKTAVAGVVMHTDQGSEGGIKRSSQHPIRGVFDGFTTEELDKPVGWSPAAGCRPGLAAADALTGASRAVACGAARVLAVDRRRRDERGGRGSSGCVDAGRDQVVPTRWRDVADQPG